MVAAMLMPLRAAAFSYTPRHAAASADLSWGFTYSPSPMVNACDTPGGFISYGQMYFYVKDYQGNVRQVTDANGTVEQDNHYYPYGMLMGESSDILAAAAGSGSTNSNPYLFGSKEYLTTAGANLLDFNARTYGPSTLLFQTQDPKADAYTPFLPYLYCAGEPVNRVDRDGEAFETFWDFGCIGYDGYSTIRNVIKGDYSAAKESAKDLAFDIAAALIPGVPAGINKVIKGVDKAVDAAKAVDKATDVAKTADKASDVNKGLKNADRIAEGKAFEKQKLREGITQGKDVVDHVTLVPQNGLGNVKCNRTVTYQLIRNSDGTYSIIETKLPSKTQLTKGQTRSHNHVGATGGYFEVRSNIKQWNIEKGTKIFVKDYKIECKYIE